jgi:hypothetical protein
VTSNPRTLKGCVGNVIRPLDRAPGDKAHDIPTVTDRRNRFPRQSVVAGN